MAYFPRPLPDELMGSVVECACLELGLSPNTMLRTIGPHSLRYNSPLMPSYLGLFGRLMGVDPEELLWKHTLFPYVATFMPPAQVARLRDMALSREEGIASTAYLTRSITHGVGFRRACAQCISEDRAQFGRSYWRRAHVLPGVFMCARHDCLLSDTSTPVRYALYRIVLGGPGEAGLRNVDPRAEPAVLAEIATRSSDLLDKRPPTGPLMFDYRARALASGYVRTNGNVAMQPLLADLKGLFGADFLTSVGAGFSAGSTNPWPALILRGGSKVTFNPVKHILLDVFLDWRDPREAHSWSYKRPGRRPPDLEALDRRIVQILVAALEKKGAGWQRNSHREAIAEAGLWQKYRHAKHSLPRTRRMVAQLRRKNAQRPGSA